VAAVASHALQPSTVALQARRHAVHRLQHLLPEQLPAAAAAAATTAAAGLAKGQRLARLTRAKIQSGRARAHTCRMSVQFICYTLLHLICIFVPDTVTLLHQDCTCADDCEPASLAQPQGQAVLYLIRFSRDLSLFSRDFTYVHWNTPTSSPIRIFIMGRRYVPILKTFLRFFLKSEFRRRRTAGGPRDCA
jgi:hypothetical protein